MKKFLIVVFIFLSVASRVLGQQISQAQVDAAMNKATGQPSNADALLAKIDALSLQIVDLQKEVQQQKATIQNQQKQIADNPMKKENDELKSRLEKISEWTLGVSTQLFQMANDLNNPKLLSLNADLAIAYLYSSGKMVRFDFDNGILVLRRDHWATLTKSGKEQMVQWLMDNLTHPAFTPQVNIQDETGQRLGFGYPKDGTIYIIGR